MADADPFPSKDQVADYQERYAAWRGLALRLGVDVRRVRPVPDGYVAETGSGHVLVMDGAVDEGQPANGGQTLAPRSYLELSTTLRTSTLAG